MDTVSGVGVLDKSVALLRAVERGPLGLSGLQHETGMPRATAHRLANALVDHGLLRRTGDQRYDLGPALLGLGNAAFERLPLAAISQAPLERLRSQTGQSVQLFVTDGDQRRCVRSLASTHALQWVVPEGALFPLGQGSAGRVLTGDIGARGWTHTVAEREPGVASVSAPVFVDGDLVAAVSVSGPIERLGRRPGDRFGVAAVEAATRIGELMQATHPR